MKMKSILPQRHVAQMINSDCGLTINQWRKEHDNGSKHHKSLHNNPKFDWNINMKKVDEIRRSEE